LTIAGWAHERRDITVTIFGLLSDLHKTRKQTVDYPPTADAPRSRVEKGFGRFAHRSGKATNPTSRTSIGRRFNEARPAASQHALILRWPQKERICCRRLASSAHLRRFRRHPPRRLPVHRADASSRADRTLFEDEIVPAGWVKR
jgi:hypothetical protein